MNSGIHRPIEVGRIAATKCKVFAMFRALMAQYLIRKSVVNLVAAVLRSKGLQKCGHRLDLSTTKTISERIAVAKDRAKSSAAHSSYLADLAEVIDLEITEIELADRIVETIGNFLID